MSNTNKIVYRIRRSWTDTTSQIGAYYNLDYAKSICDKYNGTYKVYDNNGNQIYPTNSNTDYPTWIGVKTFSYSKDKDMFISKHFQVKEFASISNSYLYTDNVLIDYDLILLLEKLYNKLNCTCITVTSGYRCVEHDKAVGGTGIGQHCLGKAVDIICKNKNGIINSKIVCCVASDLGFNGVANINNNYRAVHCDVRQNNKYYGDEIIGYNSIWNYNSDWTDFYIYFNLSKEDINKYII